ncbi:uncharacterized protein LOC116160975 [Photinus pyralis]|uniref:uncharacterized protein LOC116160975 n=1 Tax=Photinus pyralis TaxID=7054 RepID=UPI0012670873|nr:uncharacterized protein LOC116160975 [Photinus pyralis]
MQEPVIGNADNHDKVFQWLNVSENQQQEEHASNADESSSLQTVSNASSARAIHIISDVQLKKPNSRPGDKLEKSDENSFQPISEVFPQDLEVPSNSQSVKATLHKLRWKKKKTYCKFCNESVTNFERHLQRNHAECKEVIEFLSFPKRSQERKTIITLLRNSGHFDEFLRGNVLPVYRGNITQDLLSESTTLKKAVKEAAEVRLQYLTECFTFSRQYERVMDVYNDLMESVEEGLGFDLGDRDRLRPEYEKLINEYDTVMGTVSTWTQLNASIDTLRPDFIFKYSNLLSL